MSVLNDLEAILADVGERTTPSVARIGRHHGRGSGWVAAPGLLVTSAHNLRDRTTTVTFADGTELQAEVAGLDAEGDLAVLRAETADRPPIARSEGGASLRVGQAVIAAGALPGGGARVTLGFVTAVDQSFRGPAGMTIPGGVEHSAPAGQGASGGPLLDGEGRLAGIDTLRLGDGLYLALPATAELERRLAELAEGRAPTRVRIGVALTPPPAAARLRAAVGLPPRDGLLVAGVEGGSPAEEAGLRQGDLIVGVDGRPVARPEELRAALAAAAGAASASVTLRVARQEAELDVIVTLPGGTA